MGGAAKVDERPLKVLRPPEDVAGLEVAVHEVCGVQPLQPCCHVAEHLHQHRPCHVCAQSDTGHSLSLIHI